MWLLYTNNCSLAHVHRSAIFLASDCDIHVATLPTLLHSSGVSVHVVSATIKVPQSFLFFQLCQEPKQTDHGSAICRFQSKWLHFLEYETTACFYWKNRQGISCICAPVNTKSLLPFSFIFKPYCWIWLHRISPHRQLRVSTITQLCLTVQLLCET